MSGAPRMAKTKPGSAIIRDRDPLTKVINGYISKPKATSTSTSTIECTGSAISVQKKVYIVTSTLSDPYSPDTHDVSNVFPTLQAANEAAKHFGDDYGFYADPDENDEYQEQLTSDGRLVIHMEGGEEETFDVRVEARTLEVPATDAGQTTERQHKGLSEVERRKKDHRVYIVTHEEYDHSIGDWGHEEIIGVYGSVAKANIAARARMKDNLGGSEDEGSEGENEVDSPEESFDSEGSVTLTAEDGIHQQWMCSVNSYKVG